MKRFLAVLAAFLMVSFMASAEDTIRVVQTACNILVYGDECQVFCCAQVHNDTNRILGIESGTVRLLYEDTVVAEEEVERLWPYFLDPGGDGYLFQLIRFLPDAQGNPVIPAITGVIYDLNTMNVPATMQNQMLESTLEIERTQNGGYAIVVSAKNAGEETVWDTMITYGLYTSGGSLLYADGESFDQMGISPGSQLEKRFSINSQIVAQWENYGVEPAEFRVFAYYRSDTD
ncbi:MAG: hypothetical protein IJ719_11180 [Clostridia bacterium]|nr:hypothetical protein [Clostridia bacterium]